MICTKIKSHFTFRTELCITWQRWWSGLLYDVLLLLSSAFHDLSRLGPFLRGPRIAGNLSKSSSTMSENSFAVAFGQLRSAKTSTSEARGSVWLRLSSCTYLLAVIEPICDGKSWHFCRLLPGSFSGAVLLFTLPRATTSCFFLRHSWQFAFGLSGDRNDSSRRFVLHRSHFRL